jgi:LysM repeat protein
MHQSIQSLIAKSLGLTALALLLGLGLGTAQAGDMGPRHHAEGQYDAATSTYRVVAGDYLDVIAERFGVTVHALRKANKLGSRGIEIGQRLAIPRGPAETAAAVATGGSTGASAGAAATSAAKTLPRPPYIYGDAYKAGIEAYIYGMPLVLMDQTRRVTTQTTTAGQYSAPMGQFARMQTQVSPAFKNVVRISLNGIWCFASVDLDQGPVVLTVPDTEGRYYVAQALDMWTDDFASIGIRTTGPGDFLIAGPKWNGTAPGDIK